MTRPSDEKNTPEDLFEAFTTEKGAWNLLRVYMVRSGTRGSWVRDLDPSQLPDIRVRLAEMCGPGIFDLELAKKASNAKGKQCRVEIDLDMRSPAAQAQANGGQHVYAQPVGMPQTMYPTIVQQQPSNEYAMMRAELAELRNMMKAGNENLTQQLLRDMLTERNRAGASYLLDQRATFEQAFQLGQKASARAGGIATGREGSWSDPRDVAPLLETAGKFFSRLLDARAGKAALPALADAPEVDQTAAFVAYIKTSITEKVPAKVAVAQVRALLGEAALRQLVEQRHALVEHFFAVPDMQPLLADQYAQAWLQEAVTQLDEIAGVRASPEAPQPMAEAEVLP